MATVSLSQPNTTNLVFHDLTGRQQRGVTRVALAEQSKMIRRQGGRRRKASSSIREMLTFHEDAVIDVVLHEKIIVHSPPLPGGVTILGCNGTGRAESNGGSTTTCAVAARP